MCESTYGADRPLDVTTFTDIVELYPASGIALIKRSPVIAVSAVSVRRKINNFGSSSSEWQLLTRFPSPCGVNIVGNPRPMNTIYYAVFKVRFLQLT